MPSHLQRSRGSTATAKLACFFEQAGAQYNEAELSPTGPVMDGEIIKDGVRYTVEVKSLSEGRPDRVIPLLSQAILQAQRYAAELKGTKPMAVLYVEQAPESMFKKVIDFMETYRPRAAIAIVTSEGLGLVRWNDEGPCEIKSPERLTPSNMTRRQGAGGTTPPKMFNLFSDLNQWMLKVLLAPDIREDLLNAPRNKYRSGSELANAAQCSQMSASRLLQHLRQERFLDEYTGELRVVRREELFKRWRAAAMRSSPEIPMRFTIRAGVHQVLQAPDVLDVGARLLVGGPLGLALEHLPG